jgi:UDP-N-acetylmuramate dehydrogenase
LSLQIQENIPLAPYTTLKIGGAARYFVEAKREEDVREAVAWAKERRLQLFVLGGGSNLVVADSGFAGLVLKVGLAGVTYGEAGEMVRFTAAAGQDWDAFVAQSVAAKCGGIECLSGIPGTVGGTPVQNVGAYGQEVAETITSVRALEIATGSIREFSNADCRFAYRTSLFNSSERGKWIVLGVTFGLKRHAQPKIEYADLKKYFAGRGSAPTLAQTREAVRAIRQSKAMLITEGDEDCRSAGSFFKNPILSTSEYEKLLEIVKARGQMVPTYPAGEGHVKVSAAWLVEQAGFAKGYTLGRVGINESQIVRAGIDDVDLVLLRIRRYSGGLRAHRDCLQPLIAAGVDHRHRPRLAVRDVRVFPICRRIVRQPRQAAAGCKQRKRDNEKMCETAQVRQHKAVARFWGAQVGMEVDPPCSISVDQPNQRL